MEVKKILGQIAPAANTLTDLYEVPDSKGAVISSLVVCNRGATATTFRVAVSYGGAEVSNKDYLYYDVELAGNDTFVATIGITLSNADVVRCHAGSANLSFNVFGAEFHQQNQNNFTKKNQYIP